MSTAATTEAPIEPPFVQPQAHAGLRQEVKVAARRFKASWAELGKLLVRVRDEAAWEAWGYDSFDQYCLKEVHIRRATAEKLLRSFSFLARHEPKVVEEAEWPQRAPAFEVVEVLADAEQRGQLGPEDYQAVRHSIWDTERPTSDLRREFSERFPPPPPLEGAPANPLKRLAEKARRLALELSSSARIPQAVAERATALAEDLEELASAPFSD